jgi:hypothetical protein
VNLESHCGKFVMFPWKYSQAADPIDVEGHIVGVETIGGLDFFKIYGPQNAVWLIRPNEVKGEVVQTITRTIVPLRFDGR